MNDLLGQLPALQPGELEKWLASAMAVAAIGLATMKLSGKRFSDFVTREEHRLFRVAVEGEISSLRDRIDSRHLAVVERIEALQNSLGTEAERRDAALHRRLGEIEAGLARLDEPTRRRVSGQ
jgi:hypothetical protein